MKYWREAATVILAARPRTSGSLTRKQAATGLRTKTGAGPECEDYRILMLKRSGKSSFMPSRMVFPGGTVSSVDHSRDWLDLFLRMTGRPLHETLRRIHVGGPRVPMVSVERLEWPDMSPDVTFRICGIRELFEEAGILLALSKEELSQTLNNSDGDRLLSVKQWSESEQTELKNWRKLVNSNADAFLEMCVKLDVFPNIWELHEWNNWLTPVLGKTQQQSTKKPLRFDTMFYICCFECDRLPDTSADEEETVLCQWKRPLEFLSAGEDNHLTIDIPQGYELKRLLNFPSLEELNRFSAERESKGLLRCFPVIQLCQDGFIALYPGDCRYPENPDFEGTAGVLQPLSLSVAQLTEESNSMHRLVFENANMKLLFICNRPLPFGHVAPVEQSTNLKPKL